MEQSLRDVIQESCYEIEDSADISELWVATQVLSHRLQRFFKGGMNGPSGDLSGGLLSSDSALQCLVNEPLRTQLYQAAVCEGVARKVEEKGHCRVAYLGTGPAASLVLPALTRFTPEQLSVCFVEGNANSYRLLQSLLTEAGFRSHVEAVHNMNAVSPLARDTIGRNFDVVVTETMAQALLYEPQFAITQNLGRFILAEDGLWIPEAVNIGLRTQMDGLIQDFPFFSLTKDGVKGYSDGFEFDPSDQYVSGTFDFGSWWSQRRPLKVRTSIQVDATRELPPGTSTINPDWTVEVGSYSLPTRVKFSYYLGEESRRAQVTRLSDGHAPADR